MIDVFVGVQKKPPHGSRIERAPPSLQRAGGQSDRSRLVTSIAALLACREGENVAGRMDALRLVRLCRRSQSQQNIFVMSQHLAESLHLQRL